MGAVLRFVRKVIVRESYHPLLTYPIFLWRVQVCRMRYRRTLKRLKAKLLSGEKLKVMFLSMDTSMWKCQSLYELMAKSDTFDPVIGLTITYEDDVHTPEDIRCRNAQSRQFYEKFGDKVVEACVPAKKQVIDPAQFGVDIVFYQVPWGNLGSQTVWNTSRYALTCYMPYGIEIYSEKARRFDALHMPDFHQLMWANYSWCPAFARYLFSSQFPWEWAGRELGLGHTIFDAYTKRFKPVVNGRSVIYAPHFQFSWKACQLKYGIGTFDWSGREILEYAQHHPELNWIFKPHPKLRERLVEIGFMTKDEVDAYYASWEALGRACYDGDYMSLFADSFALITDCESFLSEYMATESPLIHLIPKRVDGKPNAAAAKVVSSFYSCNDLESMRSLFAMILEERKDPKREERLFACRSANLVGINCALRIMDQLTGDIKSA